MIRKSLLALAAVGTIAAATMTPTAASAGWKHGWHGWHGHSVFSPYWGFYGPRYVSYVGYDCYWVKKKTPYGKKLVKVCY